MSSTQRYSELLAYEFSNRAFAFRSTKRIASMREGSPIGNFYKAYHAFEVANQNKYCAMSSQLEISCKHGWYDRTRGFVVGVLGGIVGGSPKMLASLVISYLPDLEELRDLSAPEHRAFFDYVIAQETAQLHAADAADQEGWDAGAQVFLNFIEAHSSTP